MSGLPLILVVLGVITLLPLLFIPVRMILRKQMVPLPSSKLPPSGAAPWSRTPITIQPERPWPYTLAGNSTFNAAMSAPVVASFNAAPTIVNAPSNPWQLGAAPAGPPPFATPPETPVAPVIHSYTSQPQSQQAFAAPPAVPGTGGYAGLIQGQQPLPATPPLPPQVQTGQTAHPTAPDDPFADASQSIDTANPAERKRLRRNGLRPTSDQQIAIPAQFSGEASADMEVFSDPYLQAMLKRYSEKGQAIKQAPEESS